MEPRVEGSCSIFDFDFVLLCSDLNGALGTLVGIDGEHSSIFESHGIMSHKAPRYIQSLVRFFV